ncbi:MAG: protein-glutamate O-methyltransferase CheR [Planctomycetes bacterium]|nr:protein-glutamate O-methyltransferase CheR [Planctomycetota bacterium]
MTKKEAEIQELLEAIYSKYGYDFQNYSRPHIERRLIRELILSDYNGLSELAEEVLSDSERFYEMLADLFVHTTSMFRDVDFYNSFRRNVVPELRTYPSIRIWNAGCATGEEVYSIAIILKEEGLYAKTRIYATDISNNVLRKAKEGIFPISNMKEYTELYQKSGGCETFSNYYKADHNFAMMGPSLRKNVVFSSHNLVTDEVFAEMNVILCRNVLIYFNNDLQARVFKLFRESLCIKGFLCLGSKENVRFSPLSGDFDNFIEKDKIYKRRY